MNGLNSQTTVDYNEALQWATELGGSANFLAFWFPQERFVRATRRGSSMSATRIDGENVFAMAIGPDQVIEEDWTHFSLSQDADPAIIDPSKFKQDGMWRAYSIETSHHKDSLPALTLTDNDEINNFLESNFPDSSVKAGNEEIVLWGGLRNEAGELVAVGGLAKWESGELAAVSIGVHKDHYGKGLGQKISAGLTRCALDLGHDKLCLGVFAENYPAIAVYEKCGYQLIEKFNHYALNEETQRLRSRP